MSRKPRCPRFQAGEDVTNRKSCTGPIGHRFRVTGEFWQNVVGIVHLNGICVNCDGRFVVPVVRDMDRAVVAKTSKMRVSKPARRVNAKED